MRYREIVREITLIYMRETDKPFWGLFFSNGNCMPISRTRHSYECSHVKTVSLRVPSIDSLSKWLSYQALQSVFHLHRQYFFRTTVRITFSGDLLDTDKRTLDMKIFVTIIIRSLCKKVKSKHEL